MVLTVRARVLGSLARAGAFSVVYRGRWRGVECAVKQLSVPTVDIKAKQEFRKEASLMQYAPTPLF